MAGITPINPLERLRVWAGIPKAHVNMCSPLALGLMHIQAAVEKLGLPRRRDLRPCRDDSDYPDFEEMLAVSSTWSVSRRTRTPPDVLMTINLVRKLNLNAKIFMDRTAPCSSSTRSSSTASTAW